METPTEELREALEIAVTQYVEAVYPQALYAVIQIKIRNDLPEFQLPIPLQN